MNHLVYLTMGFNVDMPPCHSVLSKVLLVLENCNILISFGLH